DMTAQHEAPAARDDTASTGSVRRCIVSRAVLPKEALVRFVVGPQREIVPDVDGRLPGRGLWVSADRASLARAVARNAFIKAASAPVRVPDDLVARVERLLAARCLDLIGLACGAGSAVAGFEKVRDWLSAGRAGLLLAAADGAADGRQKLRALARDIPVVELFSIAELAGALGRDTVVHAAVARGGFAKRILVEAGRLAGFRRAD
ncbi:MAG: RNA-binding protein, partial [Dongiaceae bacterium]